MLFGKKHVERYEETDGAEGHDWQGTTALILTTRGRRSGETRRTPLIYQRDGDAVLVVASNGGEAAPGWYHNLRDDPQVGVQIKDDRFSARARDASDAERARLWPVMTAAWPDYDEYQKKTDRPIPIVVLEREG